MTLDAFRPFARTIRLTVCVRIPVIIRSTATRCQPTSVAARLTYAPSCSVRAYVTIVPTRATLSTYSVCKVFHLIAPFRIRGALPVSDLSLTVRISIGLRRAPEIPATFAGFTPPFYVVRRPVPVKVNRVRFSRRRMFYQGRGSARLRVSLRSIHVVGPAFGVK